MRKVLILSCVFFINIFFFQHNFVCAKSAAEQFNQGLKNTAKETGHLNNGKAIFDSPQAAIGTVINVFLSFLGVFFLLLMIYGGFIWMMSRGNEQEIEKAKNIITNAIIGLIVVLAAYAITAFVGNLLSKNSVSS